MNKLSEKLKEMMQVVCEKERLAKERMKKHYDKNANLREFNECALVLVGTDLAGKLEDIWESPYEITKRISVTLAVPTRRTKKRVVHINMLKAWKSPEAPPLSQLDGLRSVWCTLTC